VLGRLDDDRVPAISGATVLPAANISGWLNGTIRPTTPNGCISV